MDVKHKKLLSSILSVSYCLLILFLLSRQWTLLAFVIFYVPFVIFVVKNGKYLFEKIHRFLGTVFFTSGIYYICRVFAEKNINGEFGIDKEFINYSASVYAFFIAIPISIMVSALFFILVYWLKVFYYFVASRFTDKYDDEYQSTSFNLRYFVILGYMFLAFPVLTTMDYLKSYYILLDSYAYSDCNAYSQVDRDITYLRQNKNYCLKIQLKGFGISPEYQSIPAQAEE